MIFLSSVDGDSKVLFFYKLQFFIVACLQCQEVLTHFQNDKSSNIPQTVEVSQWLSIVEKFVNVDLSALYPPTQMLLNMFTAAMDIFLWNYFCLIILSREKWSLCKALRMQSYANSFWEDEVLDSFNNVSRDEGNISDQIYMKQIWLDFYYDDFWLS